MRPIPTPTNTPVPPNFIYGDLNGDKAVNSIDFALMRSFLLGMSSTLPSSEWEKAGDLNLDSSINAIDFALLRMYLLGIINTLPHKN